MDYSKLDGLIPAVVQDHKSGEVLMVGFMNEEAWDVTRRTGVTSPSSAVPATSSGPRAKHRETGWPFVTCSSTAMRTPCSSKPNDSATATSATPASGLASFSAWRA